MDEDLCSEEGDPFVGGDDPAISAATGSGSSAVSFLGMFLR
jgi:hypothetical protein